MPYDPAGAEENLAQRVTEETGSGGDVHLHVERKADEIAQQMTEDTGAGEDMDLHAGVRWTRWETRCPRTERRAPSPYP